MINESHPLILSALLGTLFTYGMTAAGAALVFVVRKAYRKFLDGSLGFAAGVMTAASFWSLIAPAIDMADESGVYGDFAFVPVAIGFAFGAAFVYAADWGILKIGVNSEHVYEAIFQAEKENEEAANVELKAATVVPCNDENQTGNERKEAQDGKTQNNETIPKPSVVESSSDEKGGLCGASLLCCNKLYKHKSWHRILLLIIAITVHNIPEGLAVGVAFGAVGHSKTATFSSAKSLALGIGIQNFPEGLAVSLPLRGLGMPAWKAFLWGQFSGMVEPVAGLLGCWAVTIATPMLPYALAFAAGAMIFVVMDDIMPEAHSCGNGKIASVGSIIGFIVMMSLDVALG